MTRERKARLSSAVPFATDPQTLDAMLAALVEAADDAIILKDPDGTILHWNPGGRRDGAISAASGARAC